MSRRMSPQFWAVTVAAATFVALYTTLSPSESPKPEPNRVAPPELGNCVVNPIDDDENEPPPPPEQRRDRERPDRANCPPQGSK